MLHDRTELVDAADRDLTAAGAAAEDGDAATLAAIGAGRALLSLAIAAGDLVSVLDRMAETAAYVAREK